VATRTGDCGFQAARSKRFGGDVIGAGAVEHHDSFEPRMISINQGTHAAEIAFAFFAHVTHEKNRALWFEVRELRGTRNRQKSGNSGAIVGNSRRAHAAALAADFHIRFGGKNRVHVRGEDDHILFVRAAQFTNDVPSFIGMDGEARFSEQILHRSGSLTLLKRGRRDFREVDLLVVNPGNVWRKPVERRANPRVVCDT
jgi:hypothetical protein